MFLYYFLKLISSIAYAQQACGPQTNGGYILCAQLPGQPAMVSGPAEYISIFFKYGMGLVGLIGFAVIVWSGFNYIIQRGNYAKLADIKDHIYQAVFGIVLLFASVLILNELDPSFTQIKDIQLKEMPRQKLENDLAQIRDEKEEEETRRQALLVEKESREARDKVEQAKGDPKILKDAYIDVLQSGSDTALNAFLNHLTIQEKSNIFFQFKSNNVQMEYLIDLYKDSNKQASPGGSRFFAELTTPIFRETLVHTYTHMSSDNGKIAFAMDVALGGAMQSFSAGDIQSMLVKTNNINSQIGGTPPKQGLALAVKEAILKAGREGSGPILTNDQFNTMFSGYAALP